MSKGIIFNIQKFCINDGPGIRTTVFLKGCPLNCAWCHNPESKSVKEELFYDARKCILCTRCGAECKNGCHRFEDGVHVFDRSACMVCGRCADACMAGAIEKAGYEITVEDVLKEVLKDEVFYQTSGGGMTLSGGEPMLQFPFTLELMKAAKEKGLHTCMETCGFAKAEDYREIAEYTDIFLFDYKLTDGLAHKKYTGVSNERILDNLNMLDELGAQIILRCPIIPGINDKEAHFDGIAETANKGSHIREIHIEPYHPLGSSKCTMLGKEYPLSDLSFPENDTVRQWIDRIQSKTKITVKKA